MDVMVVPHDLADLLRDARPGDRLYCLYSLEEKLYHERLLCGHVVALVWAVATPDGDVYLEDFADADHVEIHRAGPRRGAPPQLRKKLLYRFDVGADEIAAFLSEGAELAEQGRRDVAAAGRPGHRLRGKQPLPLAPPVGGTPTPPGSDVGRPSPGRLLAPPSEPPPPFPGPGGGALPPARLDDGWVALESRLGFKRGAPVDTTLATVYAQDDRALAYFPDGAVALARVGTLVDEDLLSPEAALDAAWDERIVPFRRSGTGQRRRAYAQVVAEQQEALNTKEWRVEGPATVGWLLQAHLEQGGGPVQRHYWWRQILGLAAADPGVDEHLFLCELLETAVTADQLNLPGCEAFELAARRFQLWEEVYSEALRQVEVSGTAGATADSDGWLDERRIFLGGSRSKGHALVAPTLEKHVAMKMMEESAILKERRKGREERRMARGEGSGAADTGTGGGDHGDGGGGAGGGGGSGGRGRARGARGRGRG